MRLPGTTRNEYTNLLLANPGVVERPRRRSFTATYKLRIAAAEVVVQYLCLGLTSIWSS
jgi:hypothetical protein